MTVSNITETGTSYVAAADTLITFTTPGTYVYTVKEVVPDSVTNTNIVYDGSEYTISYAVQRVNNTLTVTPTISGGSSTTATVFTNDYLSETASVPIQKTVTGAKSSTAESYSFILSTTNLNAPMPSGSTTADGKQSKTVTVSNITETGTSSVAAADTLITFTTPGTYVYTVKEVVPDSVTNTNIVYDESEYTISYAVQRINNTLTVTPTISGGSSTTAAVFTNDYLSETASVPIQKTVTGAKSNTPESYSFVLSTTNLNAPMPSGSTTADGKQSKTVTVSNITETGTSYVAAADTLITFTTPGTYVYTVKEVVPDSVTNTNIVYDGSEYTISYAVQRVNNTLTVSITSVKKDNQEVPDFTAPLVFTNDYLITSATPVAEKTASGNVPTTPVTYSFKFEPVKKTQVGVESTENLPMPETGTVTDADGKQSKTITLTDVTGAGPFAVSAGEISFAQPGTYVYRWTEIPGSTSNCDYSEKSYLVTYVVSRVTDNGLTTLETAVPTFELEKANAANETAAKAAFDNYYYPPGTVNPIIEKVITGTAPKEDETYSFTFSAAGDAPMPSDASGGTKTVTITGAHSAPVGEISFRNPGTYTYTITEVKGKSGNCDYDANTYQLIYTVTKGADGKLAVSAVVTKNGTAVSDMPRVILTNFYSNYKPVTVDPPVEKLVKGAKPAKDETYTFTFKAVSTTVTSLEGKMPMPEGVTTQSMTVTIIGEGQTEAGVITFTEPGTYVYEYTENKGTDKNCSYDGSVFHYVFEVSKGTDGLVVKETLTKDDKTTDAAKAVFTNTYRSSSLRTGDESNIPLWFAIAACALLAAGVTIWILKKTKKNRKEAG